LDADLFSQEEEAEKLMMEGFSKNFIDYEVTMSIAHLLPRFIF
jgi:hypothetical protein